MARDRFVITDEIWEKLALLIPGGLTNSGATGRDNRLFVEAVLQPAECPQTLELKSA